MLTMAINKSSMHAKYYLFACLLIKLKYYEYCFEVKPDLSRYCVRGSQV